MTDSIQPLKFQSPYRFSVMTLLFYSESTILRMIDNCGPWVEKIYVGYSKLPWSAYNKNARTDFAPTADKEILKQSKWFHKIVVVEGEYETDEDQRNDLLNHAKADGMDYIIIQDADEFYNEEDWRLNLQGIVDQPNHPSYRCRWTVFWKNLRYVLSVRDSKDLTKQSTVTYCPNYAVNCKYPGIRFSWSRLVNHMDNIPTLPGLCLHLAWVLSDEKVFMKVQTWGHSHQFNGRHWYKYKWLSWKPGSKYLGTITPATHIEAVPYTGKIPPELEGFQAPTHQYKPLAWYESLWSKMLDGYSLAYVWARYYKSKWLGSGKPIHTN